MTIFHLEKNAANTNSASTLEGVYWSARDLVNSPIGNHHFFTFIYKNKIQAEKFKERWDSHYSALTYETEKNESGAFIYFSTVGFTTHTGELKGNLYPAFSSRHDTKALQEVINPDKHVSILSPDYDYEGHRVPFSASSMGFSTAEELMEAIMQCIFAFSKNYNAGNTYPYHLTNDNCASVVNTIFSVLGYSKRDREELGEFNGLDVGEEDLVPAGLFIITPETALFSGTKTYFFSGDQYIRITRDKTGPGKVDSGYPQNISKWNWPGNFGRNGIDAALYAGETQTYFFAGDQYIRVTRGDAGAGKVDAGYPRNVSVWDWPGNFGKNGIDAALYSGTKTYFFSGDQYIRVTRGKAGAGKVDAGYPKNISKWNWPGNFGENGIDAALYGGAKTYFFSGDQYIRVTRSDAGAGKVDAGYPKNVSAWNWPQTFHTAWTEGYSQ